MKKFLSAALIALIVTFAANICAANPYDNNPDYYYFMSVQGWKDYLDLRSVAVQVHNPPHYQIHGRFVTVGSHQNEGKVNEYSMTIKYNWNTREAFRYSDGSWVKMRTGLKGSTPYAVEKLTANALFKAAYGMTFYDD